MTDRCVDLIVGASGRVGRLVFPWWCKLDKFAAPIAQYRTHPIAGGFCWDPLQGVEPLLDATAVLGGFRSMVILAGSTPGPGWSRDLNRRIVEECLAAAYQANVSKIIIASSSAVYGINNGIPLCEDDDCAPTNDYGQAKLEMELACLPWRHLGLEICCLRIGNVAGADALLTNLAGPDALPTCEIDIFQDGRGPLRSYIGPQTFAEVMRSLCEYSATLPRVLNFAAPLPVYMEDLAEAAGHRWSARSAVSPGHQRITLDCSRLSNIYSFDPIQSEAGEIIRQWQVCRAIMQKLS